MTYRGTCQPVGRYCSPSPRLPIVREPLARREVPLKIALATIVCMTFALGMIDSCNEFNAKLHATEAKQRFHRHVEREP